MPINSEFPKNNCQSTVLETALSGQVKYLVTRDDDIKRDLNLVQTMGKHGIEIITVSRFLEMLV